MVASQWGGMIKQINGVFTVCIAGEIDAASAGRFRAYLLGAVSMARHQMTVDLRAVQYLDSSAIHALLAACDAAEARDVRITADALGLPRRVIELAGLAFLLEEQPEPVA